MNIAYGIHGYGYGHATRSMAVIEGLQILGHSVTVFAGGRAIKLLDGLVEVKEVPCFAFHQSTPGKTDPFLTGLRNAPYAKDLIFRKRRYKKVKQALKDCKPDILITDSEAWTAWAAKDLMIPTISFDHYGIIAWCDVKMGLMDRLRAQIDKELYRLMIPNPDRALISSFYYAEPISSNVSVIPSILRKEVEQRKATKGNHILAYFSMGMSQRDFDSLQYFDDVRLYGTARSGVEGNIIYKTPSNDAFLDDLSSCKAVISGAGNQLIGEAVFYQKPVLVIPENSVEQRLNAHYVESMSIGMTTSKLNESVFKKFSSKMESFNSSKLSNGRLQALEIIEKWLGELS